jgi:hypothetical protein
MRKSDISIVVKLLMKIRIKVSAILRKRQFPKKCLSRLVKIQRRRYRNIDREHARRSERFVRADPWIPRIQTRNIRALTARRACQFLEACTSRTAMMRFLPMTRIFVSTLSCRGPEEKKGWHSFFLRPCLPSHFLDVH